MSFGRKWKNWGGGSGPFPKTLPEKVLEDAIRDWAHRGFSVIDFRDETYPHLRVYDPEWPQTAADYYRGSRGYWVDVLDPRTGRAARISKSGNQEYAEIYSSKLPSVGGFGDAASDRRAEVGKIIFEQFGGGRAMAMIGGRAMLLNTEDYGLGGLGVKWPNRQRSKGNYVEIILRPDDTYDMTFYNLTTRAKKPVKTYEGIYADQLRPLFEKQTGWYLSLSGLSGGRIIGLDWTPSRQGVVYSKDGRFRLERMDTTARGRTAWAIFDREQFVGSAGTLNDAKLQAVRIAFEG